MSPVYNPGLARAISDPEGDGADPLNDILRALNNSNAAMARMERNMTGLFQAMTNVEDRVAEIEKVDGLGNPFQHGWPANGSVKDESDVRNKDVDLDRREPKKEPRKDESFGQAAKFLRLHTHLKPIKAKPSERILLEWLEDLTDKMDVTMLNNADRKIVLQALLQEETCQRLWKPACADNDVFKDALEVWLSTLYPNSWFLTELFQDLHSKRTYRAINQVVAEVIKTQRLWTEAAARKKMKFDVDIYFWKVVLVNKIPTRYHEKIQELVNADHASFEAFCLEVSQKLELLEEKNERAAAVTPVTHDSDESDVDAYPVKRGRAGSFDNPMIGVDSDVEEMQPAKRQTTNQPRGYDPQQQQSSRAPQRRPNPQRHQQNVQKQKEKWTKQDLVCTRCNQRGHSEDSCWVFDHRIECRKCGGMNHLAICCRSKAKGLTMTFSQQKGETHDELQQQINKLQAQQEALKKPKPPGGKRGRRRSQ